MNRKTKDFLYKFGIVLACIGALGSIVAIGETIYQHKHNGGGGGGSSTPGGSTAAIEEVNPTFFAGGIADTTGKYEASTEGLYNRYPFNAKSLSVDLEPDAALSYQVFFYDNNDKFIKKSDLYNQSSKIIAPAGANARIEILPDSKSVTWDTAPLIANKLHVKISGGQKVDLVHLTGIDDSSYSVGENGNLLQVLNGSYSGEHYSFTFKNGLVTYGKANPEGLTKYECVTAKLDREITGNVTFTYKEVEGKCNLSYFHLKVDKPQDPAHADSNYVSFNKDRGKDLDTLSNGPFKGIGYSIHENRAVIETPFSIIPRWYTTPAI